MAISRWLAMGKEPSKVGGRAKKGCRPDYKDEKEGGPGGGRSPVCREREIPNATHVVNNPGKVVAK